MKLTGSPLTRRYLSALKSYLARGDERALHQAYELGRRTIADGLGVIDMARIHEEVLLSILPRSATKEESLEVTRNAGTFLTEILSPFEMTHRGFRDANKTLRYLNEALEERNNQLAAANLKLKREIAERRRVEEELRDSKEHFQELFEQAREMHQNLQLLSSQMIRVQEEERKRISRELHDEVGQALTAVNVNIAVLKKALTGGRPDLMDRINDAQMLLEQTMGAVHDFSRELRPAMLDDLGLIPALRTFVRGFAGRTGVRTVLRATKEVEKLGIEQKTVLYRVAQESLTNVAKHAHATHAQLHIRKQRKGIGMDICDNGRAFRETPQVLAANKKRLGLLGIQERVRLVGGMCQIASMPGKGTTVTVWIPCEHPIVDHGQNPFILVRPSRPQ